MVEGGRPKGKTGTWKEKRERRSEGKERPLFGRKKWKLDGVGGIG